MDYVSRKVSYIYCVVSFGDLYWVLVPSWITLSVTLLEGMLAAG